MISIFAVPAPLVIASAPEDQIVGQSLILRCDIATVRGVTSRVNIIWSSDGSELQRTEGINASLIANNSVLYSDSYFIVQLNTTDEDRTYWCIAVITTLSPILATDKVVLNINGKNLHCYHNAFSLRPYHSVSSLYQHHYVTIWSHTRSYGR